MNKRLYFASWLAAYLLLLSGCEQTLQTESPEGQTGTLRLNIGTGATAPDTRATVDAAQWEGIRTLRVIVSTDEEGIVYNTKVDGLQNVTTHTLTLENIPFGDATIYVIGNEESLGKTYDTPTIRQELGDNPKLIFVDEAHAYFHKKGPEIEAAGLPMSGSTRVTVAQGMQAVDVQLERAVVKLSLSIENATSTPLTIKRVSFGAFSGDRFYMFPTQDLDVPAETQYVPMEFTPENGGMSQDGIVVEANQTLSNLSLYLYPTYAYRSGANSPYTLSLKTSANTYEAQRFTTENHFRRNTQVNILARVTTTVGLEIRFSVAQWDNYTVDVPSFN